MLHFVGDVIVEGNVEVCKVHPDENAADILKQSLPTAKI